MALISKSRFLGLLCTGNLYYLFIKKIKIIKIFTPISTQKKNAFQQLYFKMACLQDYDIICLCFGYSFRLGITKASSGLLMQSKITFFQISVLCFHAFYPHNPSYSSGTPQSDQDPTNRLNCAQYKHPIPRDQISSMQKRG